MRTSRSPIALMVALALVALGAQGCLSSNYRVPDAELARLVRLDPDARARKVRVEQRTFFNEDPEPDAPYRPEGTVSDGNYDAQGGYYDSHSGVYVSTHFPIRPIVHRHRVKTHHGVTRVSRARTSVPSGTSGVSVAPAPTGGAGVATAPAPSGVASPAGVATPVSPRGVVGTDATGTPAGVAQPAPPSGGGGSGSSSSSSSSGGGSGFDMGGAEDAAAVIIIAAAAVTVGLVAAEGMRYDGWVRLHPDHPVHLIYRDGYEEIVPLSRLHQGDVGVAEAVIVEDEGEVWMLGRAPLDRQGFVWRMEGGGIELSTPDNKIAMAPAATMQAGFFPAQWLGLMFTTTIAGTTDRGGDLFSWQYGMEANLMPLHLGPVHAGAFGAALMALNAAEGGPFNDNVYHEPAYHAGGLAEFELTTRMAVSVRAGGYWQRRDDVLLPMSWLATAGISIY